MREQGIRVSSDHRLRALLLGPETLGRKSLGQKAAKSFGTMNWELRWLDSILSVPNDLRNAFCSGRPGLKGMICVKN